MIDIILDIETVPGPLARTNPEKFERVWDRRQMQRGELTIEEFTNRLALNPGTGQIVCIGATLRVRNDPALLPMHQSFFGGNEARLLENFWTYIHGVTPHAPGAFRLITFNGAGFDVPYILIRSAIMKIKPTCRIDSDHVDLAELLTTNTFRQVGGSLAFWLQSFGLPSKSLASGKDVFDLFDLGDFDSISSYCETCCTRTMQLFDRLEHVVSDLRG